MLQWFTSYDACCANCPLRLAHSSLADYPAPRIDTSHHTSHFTTSQTRTSHVTPASPVELSFCGTFPPWNFHSSGVNVPRTLVPWNIRSRGTFVPRERMFQELSFLWNCFFSWEWIFQELSLQMLDVSLAINLCINCSFFTFIHCKYRPV